MPDTNAHVTHVTWESVSQGTWLPIESSGEDKHRYPAIGSRLGRQAGSLPSALRPLAETESCYQ